MFYSIPKYKIDFLEKFYGQSLDANRQGKYSDVQKGWVKQSLGELRWKHFGLLMVVVVATPILFLNLIAPILRLDNTASVLIAIVLLLFAVIVTVIWLKRGINREIENVINAGIGSGSGIYYFDFKKKRYVAKCENKFLEPMFLLVGMAPGVYKFYFLPQKKILYAAEPLDTKSVPSFNPTTDSLSAVLERALGFDKTDLQANRNGQLSERQKSKVKKKLATSAVVSVLGYGWRKPFGESNAEAVSTGLELLSIFLPIKTLSDIVKVVVGFLGLGEKHDYFIGEQTFIVSEIAWIALGSGLLYKAYYLPKFDKILSIEQVQA